MSYSIPDVVTYLSAGMAIGVIPDLVADRSTTWDWQLVAMGCTFNTDELEDFVHSVSHDEDEEYAYGIESASDLFQWFDVTLLNYDEMWDGRSVRFLYDDMNEDHIELTGAFFFAQKQGSIIAGSNQLYSSIDDIVNEMREEYGKYLPDGFNYARHIAFMCGYVTN